MKKLSTAFTMVLYMICGALIGAYGSEIITEYNPFIGILILLISFYLCFFIHIGMHEAGHMIFGMLTGYQFVSYRLGNLMIIKTPKGLEFKKYSLAGTAGQCLLDPPETDACILYNLGGVLMNFILSAIALIIAFNTTGVCKSILINFAAIGLAVGLSNGIPMYVGGVANDGMNVFSLKKHPNELDAFKKQMKCNAYMAQGYRLKDIPKEFFEYQDLHNVLENSIGCMYENRLMDEQKYDEALEMIQLILKEENTLGLYRSMLLNDQNYIQIMKHQPYTLDKKLIKFNKMMKDYPSIIRNNIAYALYDSKDYSKLLQQFEKVAKNYPYASEIEGERELIQAILKEYQK